MSEIDEKKETIAEAPKAEAAAEAKPVYTDKELTCVQCGKKFVFTAGEQEFYATHFDKDGKPFREPLRCPDCRKKHKEDIRKIREYKRAGKTVSYVNGVITVTGDAPDVGTVVDCSPKADDIKKA
jgi:hypothetical protein